MSIHGGTSGPRDDEPSIVPIIVSSAPAAFTGEDATASGGRPPRDPFAPSRWRKILTRKVVVFGVLAVLVLGVGGYAVSSYLDTRGEKAEVARVEALKAAVVDAEAAVADYRLPSTIDDAEKCVLTAGWCGTSALAPAEATALLLSSLASHGVTGGESECTTGASASCWTELVFDGQGVGTVRASREDVPHRIFGEPTAVRVGFSSADEFSPDSPSVTTVYEPNPTRDRTVARTAVAGSAADSFRCTDEAEGGCLEFVSVVTTDTPRDTAWAEAGRRLVRNGWDTVKGNCDPKTPKATCSINAMHRDESVELHRVSIVVAPRGDGARVTTTVAPLEQVTTTS